DRLVRAAAVIARAPVPQPTSSSRSPSVNPVKSRNISASRRLQRAIYPSYASAAPNILTLLRWVRSRHSCPSAPDDTAVHRRRGDGAQRPPPPFICNGGLPGDPVRSEREKGRDRP